MTYTHGHHESVLRSHKWRTVDNSAAYLAPHLIHGISVLDIGCASSQPAWRGAFEKLAFVARWARSRASSS